jgi:hypothetical protein
MSSSEKAGYEESRESTHDAKKRKSARDDELTPEQEEAASKVEMISRSEWLKRGRKSLPNNVER